MDELSTEAHVVALEALSRVGVRSSPVLEWTDGAGTHTHTLTANTTVGSAEESQLRIVDRRVSRTHAAFDLRDDGLWVRDLGSTNGTRVEAVKVLEAQVPEGATLWLGPVSMRLGRVERREVELWPDTRLNGLVGRSEVMRELFQRIVNFARSDAAVLVRGETGTGKELVARSLHENSGRTGEFVVVDCGAMPEALLEAELFGHTRGAFTGAHASREGAVAAAEGGTLFLDEIGELPLPMQPKLLRLLEQGTVKRVGDHQYRDFGVRIVAATHRDLPTMVASGAFREDLYYRLGVLPLDLPPLRSRLEDLELLLGILAPGVVLDAALLTSLRGHRWKGNVRELRTFAQRAALVGLREACTLLANTPVATELPRVDSNVPFKEERERWLSQLERQYLRELFQKYDGNITRVAEAAKLDRSYVHRLVKKYDL